MADVFTAKKRSSVMACVRSSGNKDTEFHLMSLFRAHHITGWRRNYPCFGKPDFVFPKLRIAVFVDGCFWHGCPRHYRRPKSRRSFWDAKIARNKARDREVGRKLRATGWRVVRVWEHALSRRMERRTMIRLLRILGTC